MGQWVSATLSVTLVAGEESLGEYERPPSWPWKKNCTSHEDDELRWLVRQELLPLSGPRESNVGLISIEQRVPEGTTKKCMYPRGNPANARTPCTGLEMFWYQHFGRLSICCCRSACSPRIWPRSIRDGHRALTLECTVRPRGSLGEMLEGVSSNGHLDKPLTW